MSLPRQLHTVADCGGRSVMSVPTAKLQFAALHMSLGTKRARAYAVSCPQLVEADMITNQRF
jgi:hypothetical protein